MKNPDNLSFTFNQFLTDFSFTPNSFAACRLDVSPAALITFSLKAAEMKDIYLNSFYLITF